MIKSMVSAMVSPMVTSIVSIVKRVFIDLDSVLPSYYVISTPITLDDDFEVSVNVIPSLNTFIMAGDSNNSFVTMTTAGELQVSIGGTSTITSGLGITEDGKLHHVNISRVGSAVSIKLDGVEVDTGTQTGDFILSHIGSNTTPAQTHDNVISEARFNNDGIVTTFALNQTTANTESSEEANNTVTYTNIPTTIRELFELSKDGTQWDNISPAPRELPDTIEIE